MSVKPQVIAHQASCQRSSRVPTYSFVRRRPDLSRLFPVKGPHVGPGKANPGIKVIDTNAPRGTVPGFPLVVRRSELVEEGSEVAKVERRLEVNQGYLIRYPGKLDAPHGVHVQDWKTNDCPRDDAPEAFVNWLDLVLLGLDSWERHGSTMIPEEDARSSDATDEAHDAYVIVRVLRDHRGFPRFDRDEPRGRVTLVDGRNHLRAVREWVLDGMPGSKSTSSEILRNVDLVEQTLDSIRGLPDTELQAPPRQNYRFREILEPLIVGLAESLRCWRRNVFDALLSLEESEAGRDHAEWNQRAFEALVDGDAIKFAADNPAPPASSDEEVGLLLIRALWELKRGDHNEHNKARATSVEFNLVRNPGAQLGWVTNHLTAAVNAVRRTVTQDPSVVDGDVMNQKSHADVHQARDAAIECADCIASARSELLGLYQLLQRDNGSEGATTAFWEAVDELYRVLTDDFAPILAIRGRLSPFASSDGRTLGGVTAPTWHELAYVLCWQGLEKLGEPLCKGLSYARVFEQTEWWRERLKTLHKLSRDNRHQYQLEDLAPHIEAFMADDWLPQDYQRQSLVSGICGEATKLGASMPEASDRDHAANADQTNPKVFEQKSPVETSAADTLEKKPANPIKRPPERAFQAWRLRDLQGINSQTEIANKMTEMGVKASQGQVSRWLDQVEEYLKAGGIFPTLDPLTHKPDSVDPSVIEMGQRQDGRTPRQRNRRSDDSDDD